MDNQGETRELSPSPNIKKLQTSSISEEQLKVPQASQVNELKAKISSGISTDQDKIALAFSLKEKFKKDFGTVSEQEAVLLQEIAQKNNAGDIINNFNKIMPELSGVNDPITRGLVLELLELGMERETIGEIYKTGSWALVRKEEKDAAEKKLADFFAVDATDKSRNYAKGAAMIKFIPKLDFDKKIEYAKLAFNDAPTAELRYNWYIFIDESFKAEGKRFEALQFFKENKDFLFKEKIKAAEKAKPIIAFSFSDLSKSEAREELAWVLNKIFKPKELITSDDLIGSRLLTLEEMAKDFSERAVSQGDKELELASQELLRFGIPILMPEQKRGIVTASESLQKKVGLESSLGRVMKIRQVQGVSLDKLTAPPLPLYEDVMGLAVVKPIDDFVSNAGHESIHIYRSIFSGKSREIGKAIAEEIEGRILDELNAHYIDGGIPTIIKNGNYEAFKEAFFATEILPASESIPLPPASREHFQVQAMAATFVVQYLHDVGISAVDIQNIILNSRTLENFNEWIGCPKEELKTLFKIEGDITPVGDRLKEAS